MTKYRKLLDRALSEYSLASRQVEVETRNLEEAKDLVQDTLQAQSIVQEVAKGVQQKAHAKIASVVTHCLKAIFGEEAYEFRINFERKRGKTEAKLSFVRDGIELDDPTGETGGGVIDVASFALRLACVLLSLPKRRKLLILDEPFRFINGTEYQERVGILLEKLAEDLDFQFVIVTDDEWLKIGKVIEIEKE